SMFTTGCWSFAAGGGRSKSGVGSVAHVRGGFAARNAAYSALVTSVVSMIGEASASSPASASASRSDSASLPHASKTAHAKKDFTSREHVTGDHQALDLARAFVDLEDLRVAHELFDRILLGVAVAAEDLDGVGRDGHRAVGAERLRVRAVDRIADPFVE